jgi:hypothetical protein
VVGGLPAPNVPEAELQVGREYRHRPQMSQPASN